MQLCIIVSSTVKEKVEQPHQLLKNQVAEPVAEKKKLFQVL